MTDNITIYESGQTSVGITGKQGESGARSSAFFYGDVDSSTPPKRIRFRLPGNLTDSYAIVQYDIVPKVNDYIIYTDKKTDYICRITDDPSIFDVSTYESNIEVVSKISLKSDYYVGDVEFTISTKKESFDIKKRYPTVNKWADAVTSQGYVVGFYVQPKYSGVENLVYDKFGNIVYFILHVPSTSNYIFDDNIKITLEFYNRQSFIMDTMLADKYDSSARKNTLRGDYEKYSIMKKNNNGIYQETPINFDNEHLEDFVCVLKDFEQFNGTKDIVSPVLIHLEALKRSEGVSKAFICAYIKNGNFVEKFVIDEIPVDSLENLEQDSSITIN